MTYLEMGQRWDCDPRAIMRAEDDAAQTADTLATVAERHGVPVGAVSAALRGRMQGRRAMGLPVLVIRAGAVVVA